MMSLDAYGILYDGGYKDNIIYDSMIPNDAWAGMNEFKVMD